MCVWYAYQLLPLLDITKGSLYYTFCIHTNENSLQNSDTGILIQYWWASDFHA